MELKDKGLLSRIWLRFVDDVFAIVKIKDEENTQRKNLQWEKKKTEN